MITSDLPVSTSHNKLASANLSKYEQMGFCWLPRSKRCTFLSSRIAGSSPMRIPGVVFTEMLESEVLIAYSLWKIHVHECKIEL